MNPVPLIPTARTEPLCGPLSSHFAARPALHDVAGRLIDEQWRSRAIEGPPPSSLTLYRMSPAGGYRLDNLADVLIECYCAGVTVNLDSTRDFLSLERGAEFPRHAGVDLHEVETLINECAPFLLVLYQQALLDFWGGYEQPESVGVWLADYLQRRCLDAVDLQVRGGSLSPLEAATVQLVARFPEAQQRAQFDNLGDVSVWLLGLDGDSSLDPELASAILIERRIAHQQRSLVILYTLSGGLYRFDSRQAFEQALVATHGGSDARPFTLNLHRSGHSLFVAQAELLCEQLLALVERLARPMSGPDQVERLEWALDQASAFVELCAAQRRQALALYRDLLPDWLRHASQQDQHSYATRLLRLAALQRQDAGVSFLDGIVDASGYARQALEEALKADHADAAALDLDDIELVNRQVTAASGGSGGFVETGGEVRTVVLSPMQFALANLAVLRPGSVTLRRRSGAALPAWLTVEYLKALVTRLDIGQRYPRFLRQHLLDDAAQRTARLLRFTAQVREQLPLLALETHLRKPEAMSAASVARLGRVFRTQAGQQAPGCVRVLSFLSQCGATPDVACNAYLIEALSLEGCCLLYRPLHRQPLLEFADRQAFFDALCEEGALQDDILGRLEQSRRSVYARGGFAQPHVMRFAAGDEFGPLSFPAQAKLGTAVLAGDVLEHFYRASVQELIVRAEAQSVSSDESRWLGYEELGWLMLNTLLPFFNGPLAVAGWMLPLFASLRSVLGSPSSEGGEAKLGELLLNLGFLLLAERSTGRPLEPVSGTADKPVEVVQGEGPMLGSPSGAPLDRIDFSWSSMDRQLSATQRARLDGFKRDIIPERLGLAQVVPPHRGLHWHEQRWWVVIEGAVYEVSVSAQGVRLIDASAHPGPWLLEAAPGQWRLDLRLRLRGGMPLSRRIQQMREAKRQRLEQLERERIDLLGQRLTESLQLRRDLDGVADTPQPPPELLERYAAHLRSHETVLVRTDELYRELNQLQPQIDFNRNHARNLRDLAANHAQLLYVLRHEFAVSHKVMRDAQLMGDWEAIDDPADFYDDRYETMMAACREARETVREVLRYYASIDAIRGQLAPIPGGADTIAEIKALLVDEPTMRSWVSSELALQGALILDADRGGDSRVLYASLLSARLGLQMHDSLSGVEAFSDRESLEILDSVVRHLVDALELARSYGDGERTTVSRPLLESFMATLARVHGEAENALAERIRNLSGPEPLTPSPLPAQRKQVVIRTRNRGVIVGARRKAEGGRPDAVVVIDPIDNSELARYQESSEAGVWEPVTARAVERPAPSLPALATLLKRAASALGNADRQMIRIRAQARTATIAGEMEEIMALQARPLDALVQQIETVLTRENAVDDSAAGLDAARLGARLTAKASQLREEGRRLRIGIIKGQPPTVGHVDYLLRQGEATISRLGGRVALARRKGLAQDYLQEYVVNDAQGNALWYAHFHYASLEAMAADFTAGHLKTREQRFDRAPQQVAGRNSQAVIQVYRSRIDRKSAQALFLTV